MTDQLYQLAEKAVEELERLAKAATPGPWQVNGVRGRMERQEWLLVCRYDADRKKDENIACCGYDPKTGLGQADAAFIAAANPQAILALIKEKREARSNALEEAAKILDDAANDWNRIRDPGMANNARCYAKKIRALTPPSPGEST